MNNDIIMNNDFNQLGYGYIFFQVGKGDNRRISVTVKQYYFAPYLEKLSNADIGWKSRLCLWKTGSKLSWNKKNQKYW